VVTAWAGLTISGISKNFLFVCLHIYILPDSSTKISHTQDILSGIQNNIF
jgi:hypothetical protein